MSDPALLAHGNQIRYEMVGIVQNVREWQNRFSKILRGADDDPHPRWANDLLYCRALILSALPKYKTALNRHFVVSIEQQSGRTASGKDAQRVFAVARFANVQIVRIDIFQCGDELWVSGRSNKPAIEAAFADGRIATGTKESWARIPEPTPKDSLSAAGYSESPASVGRWLN